MKFSCIIPAYNEGERISGVLDSAVNHPLLDEIIVIDDGSSDNTKSVISKYKGVRLIVHKKNMGKSAAIMTGIKEAKNDYLIFLDSDLIGIKKDDITSLISPVFDGEADISISLRVNSPLIWRIIGLDYISGERVIPKNLFKDLNDLSKLPGFGLEVYMNKEIIARNLRIKVVRWKEVISPYPQKKFGLIKGTRRFIMMLSNIFKTAGFFGSIYQVYKMRKLRV